MTSPGPFFISLSEYRIQRSSRRSCHSADFASSLYAPGAHNLFFTNEKDFVMHVDASADMIGNHCQNLTHVKAVIGARDVQVTVLLVELDEAGIRRFRNV